MRRCDGDARVPAKLRQFLASLNPEDADEIDEWLDGYPDAIESMRAITFPLTAEGIEQIRSGEYPRGLEAPRK